MTRNYLICQYHDKPKALGTINALYGITDEAFKTVLSISNLLDIDTATGYALDLVGRRIGVNRVLSQAMAKEYFGFLDMETSLGFSDGEFYRYGDSLNKTVRLNDEDYRFFIKAKTMKNYQNGTLGNIIDSVHYLTGENSNVIDNQNMTMHIVVNGNTLNSIKLYAIKFLDILIRPVGVNYRFLIITNNEPFGFNHDSTAFGFGAGKFVRLQSIGIQ